MKSFLKQRIKTKMGNVKNPEGKIIGTHQGIMFYTIGERVRPKIGIEINKNKLVQKKWYVAKKIIN